MFIGAGSTGLGLYVVAATFRSLFEPVTFAARPLVMSAIAGDGVTRGAIARLRVLFTSVAVASVLVAVSAYAGTSLIFGDSFSDASLAALILTLSAYPALIREILTAGLIGLDQSRRSSVLQVAGLAMMLVFVVAGAAVGDATGAALGWLASQAIVAGASVATFTRACELHPRELLWIRRGDDPISILRSIVVNPAQPAADSESVET